MILKSIISCFICLTILFAEAKPPKPTILVTGGGGYIGSHTIVELLNDSYSIVVLDNLSNCYAFNATEKPESLKRVEKLTNKNVVFNNIDIRDEKSLDKVFKTYKIGAVIHFAALKSVSESTRKPVEYYDNNVAGTNTLIQAMQNNKVKKLIYSSSATVYGNPQYLPLTENHPTGQNITNPYGRSKYFTEEILKDLSYADSQWKIILLRYFNPVGAHPSGLIGEDPTGIPNNLMPYLSQVAIGRRDHLKIFGSDYPTPDGTGVRDFIHIIDLASGHLRALKKLMDPEFRGCKAYNLGTGKGYSVLDLVKTFEKVSGRRINYQITDRRRGDLATVYADPNLAEKELKWRAERYIEQMCEDTWRWQMQNPNGYHTDEEESN
ncbi:UDP-glucose 4-epimerase-like [Coccinella septempunctata]|uniref:UDP-glucose 4-epimerase-like n=1 Tax=Coccinella septempunctata TaxID=41139 RepID=UPI001D098600|nr:UDP-glucose 4-epimerase-like [Coccinella septempunctata]